MAENGKSGRDGRNGRHGNDDVDLNLVVTPTKRRVRMTLSNSFGFGGSNSCVALRHPDQVTGAA